MPTKTALEEENATLKQRVATLERQLAASEGLIANISDALITTTAQNIVTSWNVAAEQLYGWSAAEAHGRLLAALVRTEYPSGSREAALQSIRETGEWSGEVIQQRKDGTRFPVWSRVAALRDDQGTLTGYVGINRDIIERKRAEHALQESELWFVTIFERSPLAIGISRLSNNHFVNVNPAMCELFGYEREEMLGHTSLELGLWPNLQDRQRMVELLQSQSYVYNFETLNRRKSGNLIHIAIWAQQVEIGNEKYLLGQIVDITAHKRAEAALQRANETLEQRVAERTAELLTSDQKLAVEIIERKQAEEELRLAATITENMVEGANMVRAADGVIIHVNARFSEMFGYELGELIGKNVSILNAPGTESPQEVVDGIIAHLDAHGSWSGDVRNRRKDGSVFWSYASIVAFVHPQHGRVWISIQEDITERKRAEDALRQVNETLEQRIAERTAALQESEVKYRTIVETAGEGIVMARPQGGYYFVNQRMVDMLGYPEAEILGKSSADFTFEDWKPQVYQARQELKTNVSIQGEFKFRRKDGSVLWTLYHATPVFDARGEHIANFAMHTDITERKRAEQQLQALSRQLIEAQESERRAVGRELHDEIGQSLTAMKILLEMAQRPPLEENCEKLRQAQHVADDLIDRVSALSLDLRPPMLDDLGLLPSLVWFARRYTTQTNIHVSLRHRGLQKKRFAPPVETAVYRLVQESLNNVARHAKVDEVVVSVVAGKKTLDISVEDAGTGFDAQSALARNRSSGLSGMRERVRLLDGDLEIISAPGKGTRIFIRLPLAQKEKQS